MLVLDAVSNHAKAQLAAPIEVDDFTLELDPTRANRFPDPSEKGEYNIVIWNQRKYPDPSDDPEVEIVRVKSKSHNIFEIERAQEGTIASAKLNPKATFAQLALTQKMIEDIDFYLMHVDPDTIAYENEAYPTIDTVKDALDELLYFPPSINLSISPSATQEYGITVPAVTLNWTLNKRVLTQSLTDVGSLAPDVRTSIINANLTASKSYTLTVTDNKNTVQKSASVNFSHKRWWGVSSSAAVSNSAQIIGLGNSEFAGGYGQTKTFNASGGRYLYFAFPAAFTGTPVFTVGGFTAPFEELPQVSHTNQSGFTTNYRIFRSSNIQNDSNITVIVG